MLSSCIYDNINEIRVLKDYIFSQKKGDYRCRKIVWSHNEIHKREISHD